MFFTRYIVSLCIIPSFFYALNLLYLIDSNFFNNGILRVKRYTPLIMPI